MITVTWCACDIILSASYIILIWLSLVAADYGSYVMIHAYHDRSINRAIDAGIRCVEHGFLMTEPTMERMVKEGIAISIQAVMSLEAFAHPEAITFFTRDQQLKGAMVNAGM